MEVKLWRKRDIEIFWDFGKVIEDLYRWVYFDNWEYVLESFMKIFLDNCSGNDDFRLVVKWIWFKILVEVVIVVM